MSFRPFCALCVPINPPFHACFHFFGVLGCEKSLFGQVSPIFQVTVKSLRALPPFWLCRKSQVFTRVHSADFSSWLETLNLHSMLTRHECKFNIDKSLQLMPFVHALSFCYDENNTVIPAFGSIAPSKTEHKNEWSTFFLSVSRTDCLLQSITTTVVQKGDG